MNIARRHIGAILGVFGGILGVSNAIALSLHNSFLRYFTANVVCGLAAMISCSVIIGAVLALKGKPVFGGYLMLLTSLIWAISPLLIFLMSIIWAITLSGIMATMNGILLTLYTQAAPGSILSLIGGALVLSAKNEPFENMKVRKEQRNGKIEIEPSLETDTEKQKTKVARQAGAFIYISAFILTLDLIFTLDLMATDIFWFTAVFGLFALILNLMAVGTMWYLAVTS